MPPTDHHRLPAVVQVAPDERFALPVVSSDDSRWCIDLPDGPRADVWRVLEARTPGPGDRRATAPVPDFQVDGLLFSDRLADAVRAVVEPYGEILPIRVDGEPFWVFHCLAVADALDERASRMIQWVDGVTPRRIGFYLGLALKEDVAAEAGIFQLPELHGTIFYARHIAERLLAVPGWTGTTFRAPY